MSLKAVSFAIISRNFSVGSLPKNLIVNIIVPKPDLTFDIIISSSGIPIANEYSFFFIFMKLSFSLSSLNIKASLISP